MKRVLITGGSSGLGRALAIALAQAGTHLIVTGRQVDALQTLADEVSRKGAHIDTHVLEMSVPEVVHEFGKAMAAEYSILDVLINNAATIKLGRIEQTGIEELDTHYAVNLRAPVILVKALMQSVQKARGQFVFINSTAGLAAHKGASYYAATKHGLKAVADALREEIAAEGATVLSVFPARINTPMQKRVLEMEGGTADLNRFLQPKEVAEAIVNAMERCKKGEVNNISLRAGEEPQVG